MRTLKEWWVKMKSSSRSNKMEAKIAAGALLADKMDLNTNTIAYEYDRLRRVNEQPCLAGKAKSTVKLNRYSDVLPFDATRVKLEGTPTGYINASYLQSRPGDVPSWSYIATQGPLATTAADFWLMVYEQNSNVIIMLTRVMEDFIEKCVQYYPEKEDVAVRYGDIIVKTVSQYEVDSDITGRELLVTGPETSNWRKVMHYQYHAWPDHGVPQSSLSIRNLCRALQSHRVTGDPIVHCSAGIGRTGTFCTIDIMMRAVNAAESSEAGERAVDVKRVVSYLRKQRYGMVQTPAQYSFCHQAIRDEINEKIGAPPSDQTDANILGRRLNAVGYEQGAESYTSTRHLPTIIETQDL